jgi:O-glycosyl hydrolase
MKRRREEGKEAGGGKEMKGSHTSFSPLLLSLLCLISCSNDDPSPNTGSSDLSKQITIDAAITYQTIDGFGASDCWTPNYVGRYWAQSEKESIARLLFSKEIRNGSPEGIGLSMWRFNLGGGTAEQGDNSGIEEKARRAECFLQASGQLDWNRQQGQQYFLEKAKAYGCESFVMFSNTPPVYYTYNGKGYSAKGAYSNLKDERYADFANYMATVAAYFRQSKGVTFDYISPVNEPQYNWEGGQEGSGWQNSQIKRLAVELDRSLTENGLDTKILLAEAGDWEYLYKVKGDAGRSNVIAEFFSPASENYIGNLAHVPNVIGGHSYWTDVSWSSLNQTRSQVASAASAKGLKVYQTEWSMLSDNYSDGYPGHDKASFLDIALYMSRVIHSDLTVANVSSWSYWTSMDVERWGHKNRFLLINLTPAGGPYGDIAESGTHEATKNLWVLGNYSRFIRPGYERINLSIANASNSFFGSAYVSPQRDTLVAVYTNLTTKAIGIDVTLKGLGSPKTIKRYTTSQAKNLEEELQTDNLYTFQPNTVTTLVYQF